MLMSFNMELSKYLNSNLKWWRSELDENGDVVIIVGDDQILESSYDSLPVVLWLMVPEVPAQVVNARIIVTNESRTIEYLHNYIP